MIALLGVAAVVALALTGTYTFAPLLAGVAMAVWLGGTRAGLLTLVVAWSLAWLLVVDTVQPVEANDLRMQWLVGLVAAICVLVFARALRTLGSRALSQATTAEHQRTLAESLQRIASELSAAARPDDIARVLIERVPPLVGATGGAIGVLEPTGMVIADSGDVQAQTAPPGTVLRLDETTLITAAAHTGAPVTVETREEFVTRYSTGARISPGSSSAAAVPMRADEDDLVGSLVVVFDEERQFGEEVLSVLEFAAGLGGQALRRARMYDDERRARETLNRITRLASLVDGEDARSALGAMCAEALAVLDAAVLQLWEPDDHGTFRIVWREPESEAIPPGTQVVAENVPGLAAAVADLSSLYLDDASEQLLGASRERARRAGARGALYVPIPHQAGSRVLAVQWGERRSPPSTSLVTLVRRIGDQAFLVLEHERRRLAEQAAVRSADETRRLLNAAATLATALSPSEVGEGIVREARGGLGASACSLVRRDGDELSIVHAEGYPPGMIEHWRSFPLAADAPLAEAVRRGEIVEIESAEELRRRFPEVRRIHEHESWLAVPVVAGGRTLGGLGISFSGARTISETDRAFALALGRQAGQALARSLLHEQEHESRMTAERRARDLVQLHRLMTELSRAQNPAQVARTVGEQLLINVGASIVAVVHAAPGQPPDLLTGVGREIADLTRDALVTEALASTRALWLDDRDPRWAASSVWAGAGVAAVGLVPLVVDGASTGVLVAAFDGDLPGAEAQRVVEIVGRQAAQPLERARALERERLARLDAERANQQIHRLQVVTESLAAAAGSSDVADVIVKEGRAALLADAAALHLLVPDDPSSLYCVAAAELPDDVVAALARPMLDSPSPLASSFRSGELFTVRGADAVGRLTGDRRTSDLHLVVIVPLAVTGRTIGLLTLGFNDKEELSAHERRAAIVLARQCGQALDRSRLFDDERIARARAARLQELTADLAGALSPDDVVTVFLERTLDALGADRASIGVLGSDGSLVWRGRDFLVPDAWHDLDDPASAPLREGLRRSTVTYLSAERIRAEHPEFNAVTRPRDDECLAIAPILSGRQPVGVAVLSWAGAEPSTEGERRFIATFASQCGQALDRAQRYEIERNIAETLQRSVLPETLSSMDGARAAARYLPGTAAVDVGGDWFDTLELGCGRLGFVVGDVVGKGVQAASTMAQLRNGMRALTLDQSDPGRVLTDLNRLLVGFADASFATVCFVTVDPSTGDAEIASAGHLPPLVVSPDGEAVFLEEARGVPLGVDPQASYQTSHASVELGSTLILYTDGLVERRDRPLDDGLSLLRDVVAGEGCYDVEALLERIVDALLGDTRGDDVAVLAALLDGNARDDLSLRLPARRESLLELRTALTDWLERQGVAEPQRSDLVLAAWEAGANAIEHAQAPTQPTIAVRATVTDDRVRIEVRDSGRWTEPRPRPDRGLGLQLIRASMTTVDVLPSQEGTRVVMERELSSVGSHEVVR